MSSTTPSKTPALDRDTLRCQIFNAIAEARKSSNPAATGALLALIDSRPEYLQALNANEQKAFTGLRATFARVRGKSTTVTRATSEAPQAAAGFASRPATASARDAQDRQLMQEWQAMPIGDERSAFAAKNFDAIRRAIAAS